jgi:hypothetical protein
VSIQKQKKEQNAEMTLRSMQGSPSVTLAINRVNSLMSGGLLLYEEKCAGTTRQKQAAQRDTHEAPLVTLSMKYSPNPNSPSFFMKPLSVTVSKLSGNTVQNSSTSLEEALVTGQLQPEELAGSGCIKGKQHDDLTDE